MSGLLLVLFIWGHMFFESSILISKDAMYRVTKFFEGRYFFGADYPILVTLAATVILAIFVLHAALAMRKFPASYREYQAIRGHIRAFDHGDTSLWWLQVWTGFALFFLGSVHLINMITQPGNIGPYASADRIVSGWMWPVYAMLLVTVHLHAGIGVYRLAVKWDPFGGANPEARLLFLRRARWAIVGFFLLLGFASLGTYIRIGIEHREHKGERYVPGWERDITNRSAAPETGAVPYRMIEQPDSTQ